MGALEESAAFFDERWPEARAVSDPTKELYRAFGLTRGSAGQLLGPRVLWSGLAAFVRHGAGKPVGDPMMMSGWFLVDGERVLWEHVHEHAGAPRRFDDAVRAWEAVR